MLRRWRSNAAVMYDRFIRLRGSPKEIALGLALGLFIGMSPFFGLHILIAAVFAAVFRWSKISAILGVNITNAFTAPFIYPLTYWIGSQLTGLSSGSDINVAFTVDGMILLVKQSPRILLSMTAGGAVLGIPIAVLGYILALRLIRTYSCRGLPKRVR